MRNRTAIGCLIAGVLVVALIVIGAVVAVRLSASGPVLPGAERCVATAGDNSVAVDLEQAHYAALIAGVSVRRGLPPRAASIALATAYQESGIRNLDYGDRDSIGLFQQRPSQGWGRKKQIMDPYYATGKFYDALIKVSGWQTGDINDVAQKVQRSGVPDGYRPHEADARILASVLTGQSARGITCLERSGQSGDPEALLTSLASTLDARAAVNGANVVVSTSSTARTWAVAGHMIANSGRFGIASVTVAGVRWNHDDTTLPSWQTTDQGVRSRQVVITLR